MKKTIIIVTVAALVAAAAFFLIKGKEKETLFEINPFRGEIALEFRLDGDVSPRNRLEIKPQVSGRIEDVLVVEGQKVKKGDILAWMSSSDRASLLDAARSKGAEELKKWEDIYKPTPIITPLDGFIIDRSKEPGQTVAMSEVILVMADQLILQANVDETDLRYIHIGQNVKIVLDAYPDRKFPGVIEHIAYESTVINNVTVYQVKILPKDVPPSFRAGMSATIEVVSQKKDNALLLPAGAITTKDNNSFVTVRKGKTEKTGLQKVETGISNGKNIEILSGVTEQDLVVVPKQDYQNQHSMQMRGGIGGLFGGGGRGR
ncbi:MAG: efflux RND transporter periplasmic adaptor subunit [Elusimicrobiota bacterium]